MTKIEINPNIAPFPKPTALLGSLVDGTPNFMNIVWLNRVNRSPNIWVVSVNKKHQTMKGIQETGWYSLNFPNTSLVEKTDYCGLVSGRDVDKSKLFEVFYDPEEKVPLIKECPVCAACVVTQYVELPDHFVVFGEVKHVYSEEQFLTDGELDPLKMDPIIFTRPGPIGNYWSLGTKIGKAWAIGKNVSE